MGYYDTRSESGKSTVEVVLSAIKLAKLELFCMRMHGDTRSTMVFLIFLSVALVGRLGPHLGTVERPRLVGLKKYSTNPSGCRVAW